jgi:hypothetical protein
VANVKSVEAGRTGAFSVGVTVGVLLVRRLGRPAQREQSEDRGQEVDHRLS